MKNKQDRRSQRTRHLVGEAFVQLLREKGYSTITVSDIIQRADIGRSTFYSHFRDKEDLFLAQLDRVIEALSHHMPDQREIPFFPSLGLFRHVGEEYELYKAILWTPGIDLFVKHLQNSLSDRIEQGFQERGRKFEIPIPVMASFIAGSFLTLLQWWLENKMIYSPEQMDAMFKKLTMAGIETLQIK